MKAKYTKEIYKKKFNTTDIAQAVMNGYHRYYTQVDELAHRLSAHDTITTCDNIFKYLLSHVSYIEDPIGVQWIKSPARLLADKSGDCKSYSIFIASCLRCLHIPHFFRFVSFSHRYPQPTHVYIIAIVQDRHYILDAVTKRINYQVPFTYSYDTNIIQPIKYPFKHIAGLMTIN